MKRWSIMLGCLLVLYLLPGRQETKIGSLKPVEVLLVSIEENRICVATDTKDRGVGITLTAALEDMKASSSGEIFLETVSYVLVTEETRLLLEQLSRILRPGTLVLLSAGQVEPEKVAEFLAVHKTKCALRECADGQTPLPKLMTAGERYYLVQPESHG